MRILRPYGLRMTGKGAWLFFVGRDVAVASCASLILPQAAGFVRSAAPALPAKGVPPSVGGLREPRTGDADSSALRPQNDGERRVALFCGARRLGAP